MHHYLFSDLYEWAGQFRTINIRKAERVLDGMSVEYTDYARLEQEAERIINNFQEKHWQDFEPEECAEMLTECFAALWKLHPFREGNTRTISTFVLHFIQTEGIEIDAFMFAKYSSYVRDSLVMASIEPYQEYEHLYKIVLDAMAGNEKPIMKSEMEEQYTRINGYDVKDYHYEPFETEE